jgi:hypothetical protein
MFVRVDGSETLRDLRTLERRILDVARVQLYEVARVAYRTARDTTLFRNRTGELRGTLDIIDKGAYWKRLIAPANHAKFIEYGTKAHVIRPKRGKFLRFYVGGNVVYARKVNHPGTAKRPFMENAARAGGQAARVLFDEHTAKAVDVP